MQKLSDFFRMTEKQLASGSPIPCAMGCGNVMTVHEFILAGKRDTGIVDLDPSLVQKPYIDLRICQPCFSLFAHEVGEHARILQDMSKKVGELRG
jgi:hypothetical protein